MGNDNFWWLKVFMLAVLIFIVVAGGIAVSAKFPDILNDPLKILGLAGVETGLIMSALGAIRP